MQYGSNLHILWLNDNPITAEQMVFMYAIAALQRGYWANVHIIVWGATIKLLCENTAMQSLVQRFLEEGGQVSACKRCAENLNVVDKLETLQGVKIYYVGERFSEILTGTDKLITL